MELKALQKTWDKLGKRDPFWAILADPTKRHGAWNRAEFFRTGEIEISALFQYLNSLNVKIPRGRALDFGCGAGRLTQALCLYFEECVGVDIAPSMIKLANKHNQHRAKCRYCLNESPDLQLFGDGSFDLIYSALVLQHIAPDYSKSYIKEFIRILASEGLAVFQLPSELVPIEKKLTHEQSAISEALPQAGFQAQIALIDPPTMLKAGSQLTLRVKVQNKSTIIWPAFGSTDGKYWIRLGNHWLDEHHNILTNDDGRTALPRDLKPLETAELSLVVTVPERPNRYVLELDMVQEGVSWFKDKGAETAKIEVEVKQSRLAATAEFLRQIIYHGRDYTWREKDTPIYDMYGIAKDEVINLVEKSKGKVIDVQENERAGESWVSFTYCITKE